MSNVFDNIDVEEASFAYRDLLAIDRWLPWTVAYSFATATSLVLTGVFRIVGAQCFWQVKSTGTSLATTAGASYIALPIAAKGIGGMGAMSNDTSNIAVGVGHVDVATSRFYPPTQGASASDFKFCGWHQI